MKFADILALAKQGYTPADIRELMALSTEEVQPEQPHTDPTAEEQEEHIDVPPTNVSPVVAQDAGEVVDEKVDKIKELEQEITRLHEENKRIARPVKAPEKTEQEIINDLARKFM